MRVSVLLPFVFALVASALPQDAAITSSTDTTPTTKTSANATGTPVSNVENCFYLSSTDQVETGWLYVGLRSGGFRSAILEDQTPFRLSENGNLYTKSNRVSMGYTRLSHGSTNHPNVDFLYFTSDFSQQTLHCRIEQDQLRCDSTTQTNGTRSDLVYCRWKDGSVTQKIFAFSSGDIPADCHAAKLTVVPCDEST